MPPTDGDDGGEQEKKGSDASSSKGPKWIPLTRDYDLERKHHSIAASFHRARDHPLLPGFHERLKRTPADEEKKADADQEPAVGDGGDPLQSSASTPAPDIDDPLRMMASSAAVVSAPVIDDPLGAAGGGGFAPAPAPGAAAAAAAEENPLANDPLAVSGPVSAAATAREGRFEQWAAKKPRILKKYTTNVNIAVTANFLEEEAKGDKAPKSVDETARLELLEEADDDKASQQQQYMNQKEYISHIEEQHENLKQAWENGERVLSLKIAIQCAKLLGDTKVPQFYPSMYVLLTDILDTFGELVFERIKEKGTVVTDTRRGAARLPDNFKASDVSMEAKETCRNWFYKTACIRELMPRLYIDLALIKCNRFLGDDLFAGILERLAKMVRGVGDPLAGTYTRAYLAKKAMEVAPFCSSYPKIQNSLLLCFDDFLFTYRTMLKSNFASIPYVHSPPETPDTTDGETATPTPSGNLMSPDEYLDLFSPALEWILQLIGQRANEDLFFALLQQYKDYCSNSAVLLHLLASFNPAYVSKHAMNMTLLIKEAKASSVLPKSRLYLVLGRSLTASAPPQNQLLPILNDVWKVVTKISDPVEYCDIAEVFVEYLLLHFTDREVNIFLKDVIKHVKKENAYKELQQPLYSMVSRVLSFSKDFHRTLMMDNFLPLFDLLEKKTKLDASKHVLKALANSDVSAADPVMLHTLFDVARTLHDSLDSLSFDDERRQIANLIILFIRKIDFGRDLEKQLSTFVECRQAFTNLDQVTEELVLRVALLATKAHKLMQGVHTKKTSAFVKACLAYCHITIPSLEDVFVRLRLLLVCGEVGLVNQMTVQAEAFLKAAISLLPDVPVHREVDRKLRSTEAELVDYIQSFSSFLLFFPGHPDHGPFYLVNGLLNAIQKYAPWKQATPGKTRVYLGILQLFCTYFQRKFPIHIQGVESNDRLYGGDAAYLRQVVVFIDTLVNEILAQLSQLGERGDLSAKKEQAQLALEFVNVIVSSLEMNSHSATMAVRLYHLAGKTKAADPRFMKSTLQYVQSKSGTWYQDIASKMEEPE